jgi:hypothetical protein
VAPLWHNIYKTLLYVGGGVILRRAYPGAILPFRQIRAAASGLERTFPMTTLSLSDAIRARIRGEAAQQTDLSAHQRAALRTWARRRQLAKTQSSGVTAPSGAVVWF